MKDNLSASSYADNRLIQNRSSHDNNKLNSVSDKNTLPDSMSQQLTSKPNNSFIPRNEKKDKSLPGSLKTGIENLSGYSMDDVKVHYNSNKPAQMQASAFAKGSDIYLDSGQEHHLPHEAWHVVQQKQGRVKPTLQLKGNIKINNDTGLEKEADIMGAKAIQHQSAGKHLSTTSSGSGIVQRTTSVNVKRSQTLLEDTLGGDLGGTKFEWDSKFDVNVHEGKVVVTIKIKSNISPELFKTVWEPQIKKQWSNRFMIKAEGKNYPIEVNLIKVDKGEHYEVTAVESGSALKSGARGHFGTANMTEWGVHDSTNIAHEVGHMLGNVDEYGKLQTEDGTIHDYNSNPGTSIMAISENNPVAKHYNLIKWAADKELKNLGLLNKEGSSEVIADISSRQGKSHGGLPGINEMISGASSKLRSTTKKEIKKPKEPESELSSALSRLKPVAEHKIGKDSDKQPEPKSSPTYLSQYEKDMQIMNTNLSLGKAKFLEHPDSWVVERLVTYIEKTIVQYQNGISKEWCVKATGGFLKDMDKAIEEKEKGLEIPRPYFMQ